MDKDQNIVYVQSQIACALIKAMGMFSDNLLRMNKEEQLAWTGDEFDNLIDDFGLGHNSIINQLREQ
jgi:hypothetical protein